MLGRRQGAEDQGATAAAPEVAEEMAVRPEEPKVGGLATG